MATIIARTAEVLIEHARTSIKGCHCGWAELGKSHTEHVAHALAAAGLLPAEAEWAVERKEFRDGDFDERILGPYRPTRPYTEDEAREQIARWTGPRGQFAPDGARLVSRNVTPWSPA